MAQRNTQHDSGSRCLLSWSERSRCLSAAIRRRHGDGRDDLCPGIVYCEQCPANPTRMQSVPGADRWTHARDSPAAALGALIVALHSYEPGIVRLIVDMFVACESHHLSFAAHHVIFVGPFCLLHGEMIYRTPHSSCHFVCAKCPRCRCGQAGKGTSPALLQ